MAEKKNAKENEVKTDSENKKLTNEQLKQATGGINDCGTSYGGELSFSHCNGASSFVGTEFIKNDAQQHGGAIITESGVNNPIE